MSRNTSNARPHTVTLAAARSWRLLLRIPAQVMSSVENDPAPPLQFTGLLRNPKRAAAGQGSGLGENGGWGAGERKVHPAT